MSGMSGSEPRGLNAQVETIETVKSKRKQNDSSDTELVSYLGVNALYS